MKDRFLKEEKGTMYIFMIFTISLSVLFLAMVWNVGVGYYSKIQAQHYADAAAMGGSVIAAEGFSSADGNGNNAIVLQAQAQRKATEILKANYGSLSDPANEYMELKKVEYNKDAEINGDTRSANWQYFSGYFSVDTEANYKPKYGGIFDVLLKSHSRVKTKAVE